MKYMAPLLGIALFLPGCQAMSVYLKPPLKGAGEVYLYLQPLPKEAVRLTFGLDEVSAVSEDGTMVPLSLGLSELGGEHTKRQRLMARGELPPGRYSGLSFRVASASLKVEGGQAALLVPEEAVTIDFIFDVRDKRSMVISLEFKYEDSIVGGVSFVPSFSIFIPDRPVTGLVGYVANRVDNSITVFDKIRREVAGVIATGRSPGGMAFDRRLSRAYTALTGDDAVAVIDISAGAAIKRITLSTGDRPREIALTPDGRVLLTANSGSDTVSVIDPGSLIELKRIEVGEGPQSILIDREGTRAYAFNTLSNSISVIDIAARTVAGTIPTEAGPLRGNFNRRGDRLYVILSGSPYLQVIDPITLIVQERIYVGRGMSSITVDKNTDLIYLGRGEEEGVEVFDPFSLLPFDRIETEGGVAYMAIDGEESNLYLVIPERDSLLVVDLVSYRTLTEIDVGAGPGWVTMIGER
jgi:YVTN family beta-propeller protein